MPIHQLFTEVLDVFGRPGRRFYEFLAKVATDETEKAKIKHLLTKDGK
jgi:sulfite reductase (NADPH) flavoprotein alpha-component